MCIVCYVIPVALHLKIFFSPGGYRTLQQREHAPDATSGVTAPLLQANAPLTRVCSLQCLVSTTQNNEPGALGAILSAYLKQSLNVGALCRVALFWTRILRMMALIVRACGDWALARPAAVAQ